MNCFISSDVALEIPFDLSIAALFILVMYTPDEVGVNLHDHCFCIEERSIWKFIN
jgi:hypothetical protein